MKKVRIKYNKDTCIGCGACQVACKEQNCLMEGEFIRRVFVCSKNVPNGIRQYPYSFSCNHCEHPKCTPVCPTGAMHISSDGTILHDDNLCIACGRCYWACPFGEISFSKTSGLTQKCDLCLSLRNKGKMPKCVSFCPTKSLTLVEEESVDNIKKEKDGLTDTAVINRKTYLILGGGAAGLYAAKAIREEDNIGRIIIITEDKHKPYRRPMLSKSPLKTFHGKDLALFNDNWYIENNIELHLDEKIIKIKPDDKLVTTYKQNYKYDKCIYALGSYAFVPPFLGKEKEGVYSVKTIEDIENIKHSCLEGNDVVIIGGGVIGIELAQQLRNYGMNITILEAMPRLMARQLDEDMSLRLLKKIREIGIQVETGISIKEIIGNNHVESVMLSDGRVYPASVVIVSCGVKSNIKIAQEAGIICSRSVCVNKYMETNVSDIWACGDVAQIDNVNHCLWSQAVIEGDIAGRNATGKHIEVKGYDTSVILNSLDLNLFSLGDVGSDTNNLEISFEREDCGLQINDRERKAFGKMTYRDGKLTGVALMGNLREMENMRNNLESRND